MCRGRLRTGNRTVAVKKRSLRFFWVETRQDGAETLASSSGSISPTDPVRSGPQAGFRGRPPAPPVPHRQHPKQQLPHASAGGTLQSDLSPCEPNRRRIACSDRGSVMTTALPDRCLTPVAPLPPRDSAQTLTLSVPKNLPFSMPIDTAGQLKACRLMGLEAGNAGNLQNP